MNHKRRRVSTDEQGVSPVLETAVAASIIVIILVLFFVSLNNLYIAYERPDIDLQAKIIDVGEILTYSPGQTGYYTPNWEDDPQNATILGLAASPLIAYGAFHLDAQNQIAAISRYDPAQSNITGLSRTCFLAGTKIVMADGSYRNIEDIHVGDLVKSFHRESGTIVNRNVIKVVHHPPDEMTDYYLVINNFLRVTPNHRFFTHGTWKTFDSITVGGRVHTVRVFSVEKVYEQVPTFNLEVEGDHNYFIGFSDDALVVHNDPDDVPSIDWMPWVLTSKDAYPADYEYSLEPYGGNYYIEYTSLGNDNYLYEVKEKTNYSHVVLDIQKITTLKIAHVPYEKARAMLGLDDIKFTIYDFNITITDETGAVYTYGASHESPPIRASVTRNVLIYHKPRLSNPNDIDDVEAPYYTKGQFTVRLFLGGTIGPGEEAPVVDWWPMFHHDLQNTGFSASTAPETEEVLWEFATVGAITGSPAVYDNKVYVGSAQAGLGTIYCLDAIGNGDQTTDLLWSYTTGDQILYSSPAVADNGYVYVGSTDNNVYCFDADPDDNGDGIVNEHDDDEGVDDPDGVGYDKIWSYTTGDKVHSSPVVTGGFVYIGSNDNKVYCLNALTGAWQWEFLTGDEVFSSPCISNGYVYIGSRDNKLYCLSASAGTWQWEYTIPTGNDVYSAPCVFGDKVYITSGQPGGDGEIYCLTTDGSFVWDYHTWGGPSSPAVADGYVYVGSNIGKVYCFTLTGSFEWEYQTGGRVWSSPAVADGKLYVGSHSIPGMLFCLDVEDGSVIWFKSPLGFQVPSSPSIADGRVYMGGYNPSKVYCFATVPDTNQPPQTPGTPSGPTEGNFENEYTYATNTTDPDGDQVYYQWDWGDGNMSTWLGPYNSGGTCNIRYAWAEPGSYDVAVKAKDVYGKQSEWSSTLTVTISLGSYRKLITINSDQVDEDLINFPILVYNASDANLSDYAQSDGGDIIFINDTDAKLHHEIERFNGATGTLWAWVNVTEVSKDADTTVWMYYGNNNCSNQQNITGTWDSNYTLVQHLNESSGTLYDSTSFGNDGTLNNGMYRQNLFVDGGYDFDGEESYPDDHYIFVGDNPTLNSTGNITVSAWVKARSVLGNPSRWDAIVTKASDDYWEDGYGLWFESPTEIRFWVGADYATQYARKIIVSATEWNYVVGTFNGTNKEIKIFVNGFQGVDGSGVPTEVEGNLEIGRGQDDEWNLDGFIDEVRISNMVRSEGWIKTCYNTMNNLDTFLLFGSQQSVP